MTLRVALRNAVSVLLVTFDPVRLSRMFTPYPVIPENLFLWSPLQVGFEPRWRSLSRGKPSRRGVRESTECSESVQTLDLLDVASSRTCFRR